MGQVLQSVTAGWPGGVNTTIPFDEVENGASPRARNAMLVFTDASHAAVRKRYGITVQNRTAITGSPVILGGAEYRYLASGIFTNFHVLVTDTGRVESISTSGTLTNVATTLTSGTYYPCFAQANNCLFIVNSQDRKKVINLSGTLTLQDFGIAAPGSAPTIAASGIGSFHNGTYEARVTFVNGNTGEESSAGTTSATASPANKAINWTSIPVSADAQVTKRNLYLRNTATMNTFYLAGTVNDNVTTTASTDLLDTALTIEGPSTTSNGRPPSGVRYAAWHRNRMFVADDTTLYYSEDGHPEQFDSQSTKPVNPKDGQRITGVWSLNQDTLLIGKTGSLWALVGNDPNTWSLEIITPDIGVAAPMSFSIADGIARWWSLRGPIEWDQNGPPKPIGQDLVGRTIGETGINFARLDQIVTASYPAGQRTLWAVPESGQTRNTRIIPYNNALRKFESDGWDPLDVAAFSVAADSSGFSHVFIGGYGGQLFKMFDGETDGVFEGTTTGTFVAGAHTISAVTDLTAAFDTTGAGLKERKVTILDSDNRMVGSTRPRITANTATVLTLSSSISGLSLGQTYTYTVGGPAFEFDTHHEAFSMPFTKKRWEFFYLQSEASNGSIELGIDISFDLNTADRRALVYTAPAGAVWGAFLWGAAVWGGLVSALKRLRIAKTGVKAKARIFNYFPDQAFTIYRVGFKAEALGDKGLSS